MHKTIAIAAILFSFVLTGCSNKPEPQIEATVAAAIAATQVAMPTNTAIPPSATPEPTATNTPEPTPTATPTYTPTPAGSIIQTELDTGEVLYVIPEEGFSITLSPDWQVIDLEAMDFKQVLEAAGEQKESLKGLFTSDYFQNLVASGIKFIAIQVKPEFFEKAQFPTINIVKLDLPFNITLEDYTALNVTQMGQFLDLTSDIEQEQVQLGEWEAAKLTYQLKAASLAGQSIEVVNIQYILLDHGYAYVISLTIPAEFSETYSLPFSSQAETFRLVED